MPFPSPSVLSAHSAYSRAPQSETPGGKKPPAKDRGCACPHGGGSLDAAADPTPGRERERERQGKGEGSRLKAGSTERHPTTKFLLIDSIPVPVVASSRVGGCLENNSQKGNTPSIGSTQFCRDRAPPFQMMDGAAHLRGTGGLLPPQAPSKAKRERETERER